ncbi:MAG: hypothetical protein M1830_005347 [Pleopsidium flavum]|nr:MAG: hypothetical protein M1830_005347 [Pleopsidium flavum]
MAKRPIDEVEPEDEDDAPAPKKARTDDPIDRPSPPPGPWHEGDIYLKRFQVQELHANQVINLPNATLGDLSNPIHPLLFGLQKHTYLQPALRLASKFLDEPCLLPYWHGLIFGTYYHLPNTSQKFNAPCYCFLQRPGPLSMPQIQQVRNAMRHAAHTTTYEFAPRASIDAWAICTRTPTSARAPFPGTGSTIRLSEVFLTILHPATSLNTPQRLRTSFLLANTLAHEFTHAARNARIKPPDPPIEDFEPFFYDQRRAEVGHAWESVTLGGRIFPFLNAYNSRYGMCIEKWPDLDEKYMIVRPPLPGSWAAPIAVSRKPPKKWSTIYTIPMPFVQSLFMQKFWDQDVKVFGVKGLRFEKRLGLRMRNWDWQGGSDGFRTDDSSRGRWPDEEGIVRPGQPVRLSPELEGMDVDDESEEEEKDGDEEMVNV